MKKLHVSKLKIVINEIINWKLHMWKTNQYNKRKHPVYKFKVQCSKYQLAQISYTSSYCLFVPIIIVALTTGTVFS